MRKLLVLFILVASFSSLIGQDKGVNFRVEVSSDSILMGNYFVARFTLENAEGYNFNPPVFENFDVISGPNQSSEFSMINGEVSQKISYTFYLKPKDIGNYYIAPASIETPGAVLESQVKEVLVLPNPDGIIQTPEPEQRSYLDFLDMGIEDFESFFLPEEQQAAPRNEKKKKRKRKAYKM